MSEEPAIKKAKTTQTGFNGVSDVNNDADLTLEKRGKVPLLPKDCKMILLDIEGCTTAISFVKDVLFPYVLTNIDNHLKSVEDASVLSEHLSGLEKDVCKIKDDDIRKECVAVHIPEDKSDLPALRTAIKTLVEIMVKADVKATALKSLQGTMWKAGYASGELKGHVYADVPVAFQWFVDQGVSVNIYSSGSIGAQKLLFSKSTAGDLTPHLNGHFDTTSGGKKEAASYTTIAKALEVDPSELCFVSDAEAELVAALEAGVGHVVMSVRPGNAVMTEVGYEFPRIFSLLQLCGV